MNIEIVKTNPQAVVPQRKKGNAYDLYLPEDLTLQGDQLAVKVDFGISIHIGSGDKSIAGLLMIRSGLGTRGVELTNAVGLIDHNYQGSLIATLFLDSRKAGESEIALTAGERVAQILFIPTISAHFITVPEFSESTDRGTGGHGSTGSR